MPSARHRLNNVSEIGNKARDGVRSFLKLRLHLSVIPFPHL